MDTPAEASKAVICTRASELHTNQEPYMLNSFGTHDHGTPKSYDELLDRDGRGEQPFFRLRGRQDVGPTEVPTSWYLDREIHDLEMERIWKRVWQVVCREDDVRHVGDTWVYDIGNLSAIIVRSDTDEIKAFYNSCLHRGVTLRKCNGRANVLQCPFHGFTWSLKGELRQVPCPEQFPDLVPEELRLPEIRVGRWAGFVFVNFDPKAASLEEHLGNFGYEFSRAPLDDRVKTLHVRKIVPANWKAAQEAFMEGYHVLTTHPQNIPLASDQCSQHDAFENYSRGILARAIPSEYMSRTPTEQQVLDVGLGAWDDVPSTMVLPEGRTARQTLADVARERLRPKIGDKANDLTEADLVDTIYFTLFPNFHPQSSYVQPFYYTFRPSGDDHTQCVMDIVTIMPRGPDDQTPENVPIKELAVDELFTKVPEMGFLAAFLNQDVSNLSQIMKGLRTNPRKKVMFGREHELQIRHFYSIYTRMMGFDAPNMNSTARATAEVD
jgi:phenylpropionate dioxygenase-like ring-hydroxylating dioxygenase large terminal subunit